MSEGTPIIIKRVKAESHAHHGGSWKVAYADFVTAMMAFFMVLWILGLSQEKRAIIAGYFNDPLGFNKNEPRNAVNLINKGSPATSPGRVTRPGTDPVKKDQQTMRELKHAIEKAIANDKNLAQIMKDIQVTITSEGLQIELIESKGSVFFDSGSATVRPAAIELVKRIEPILLQSKRPIVLEGHTDAVPYGGTGYDNWDLSTDRANSMRRVMGGQGIPEEQFAGVRGYADTRLKDPDHPDSYVNRRVTILLPFDNQTDVKDDLPASELKGNIEAAFKQDIVVAPTPPNVVNGEDQQ